MVTNTRIPVHAGTAGPEVDLAAVVVAMESAGLVRARMAALAARLMAVLASPLLTSSPGAVPAAEVRSVTPNTQHTRGN